MTSTKQPHGPPPQGKEIPWGAVVVVCFVGWLIGTTLLAQESAEPRATRSSGVVVQPAGPAGAPMVAPRRKPRRKRKKRRRIRNPSTPYRVGWDRPAGERTTRAHRNWGITGVQGTRRIPLTGFTSIHPGYGARAVLLVPRRVRWRQPVTVLVHLHGYNEGYLDHHEGVRDVEYDLIGQQLAAAGHNVVVALPQGTRKSGFAPAHRWSRDSGFDVDFFVDEVTAALYDLGFADRRPRVRDVVVSGHSGGGNGLIGDLAARHGLHPTRHRFRGVLLFDGINGRKRVSQLARFIRRRVEAQVARLQEIRGARGQMVWLRRQPRLLAMYGAQGAYRRRHDALAFAIDKAFADHDTHRLQAEVWSTLRGMYRVDAVHGRSHTTILGTGRPSLNGTRPYDPIGSGGRGGLHTALGFLFE